MFPLLCLWCFYCHVIALNCCYLHLQLPVTLLKSQTFISSWSIHLVQNGGSIPPAEPTGMSSPIVSIDWRHVKLTFWLVCRYIVHSDDHNPYLASMEEFAKKLKDFHPDLLVVGGLQMMDNFPFQSGKMKWIGRHFVDLTVRLLLTVATPFP